MDFKTVHRIVVLVFCIMLPCQAMPREKSNAYVSGTAGFMCDLKQPQNFSIKDLIISWEKQSRKCNSQICVVAELYMGERKYEHVSERYQNRFMEFKLNGDLTMYNITKEDEGLYSCRVRKNSKHIEMHHEKELQLQVLANYSFPEISNGSFQDLKVESVVNLHCSSGDGFPQPRGILWTVSDCNGTKDYPAICNLGSSSSCTIQKTSETFNISSILTMTVKSNINVTCTVLAHHNISSEILQIDVKHETKISNEEYHHATYIVPCVILMTITIVAVSYCCHRKNKKTCTRSLQNIGETPTTTVENNGVTQQEEATAFIEKRENAS